MYFYNMLFVARGKMANNHKANKCCILVIVISVRILDLVLIYERTALTIIVDLFPFLHVIYFATDSTIVLKLTSPSYLFPTSFFLTIIVFCVRRQYAITPWRCKSIRLFPISRAITQLRGTVVGIHSVLHICFGIKVFRAFMVCQHLHVLLFFKLINKNTQAKFIFHCAGICLLQMTVNYWFPKTM